MQQTNKVLNSEGVTTDLQSVLNRAKTFQFKANSSVIVVSNVILNSDFQIINVLNVLGVKTF
jgi:hypothetical protein